MEYRTLPIRYWLKSEFKEGESYSSPTLSMKSADFKKYYNKLINPFLKSIGFKCNGFKATLESDTLHKIVSYDTSKFGGYGQITVAVHPKKLPTKDDYPLDASPLIYHYLFSKQLTLPNGNEDFELGWTEEHVTETCSYMLAAIKEQAPLFFNQFSNFPLPFTEVESANFETKLNFFLENFRMYYDSKGRWTLTLARIHSVYGNKESAAAMAKYCIDEENSSHNLQPNTRLDKRLILLAENIINGEELFFTDKNRKNYEEWWQQIKHLGLLPRA